MWGTHDHRTSTGGDGAVHRPQHRSPARERRGRRRDPPRHLPGPVPRPDPGPRGRVRVRQDHRRPGVPGPLPDGSRPHRRRHRAAPARRRHDHPVAAEHGGDPAAARPPRRVHPAGPRAVTQPGHPRGRPDPRGAGRPRVRLLLQGARRSRGGGAGGRGPAVDAGVPAPLAPSAVRRPAAADRHRDGLRDVPGRADPGRAHDRSGRVHAGARAGHDPRHDPEARRREPLHHPRPGGRGGAGRPGGGHAAG